MEGPQFAGFAWPAWFRLQGLFTLMTVYALRVPGRFCFAPAALLGFALRSFLLQKGIPPVSEQTDPPTVSPACIPFAEASGRLAGRSSWVVAFSKSLATHVCLAHRPLAAPLGFCLRGPFTETLAEPSPSLLSRAFHQPKPAAAPQSFDRSSLCLIFRSHKCKRRNEAALRGFLHQSLPIHSGGVHPGYVFASRRYAHYCAITSALWIGTFALPELLGMI
jgi:hypothetical protein